MLLGMIIRLIKRGFKGLQRLVLPSKKKNKPSLINNLYLLRKSLESQSKDTPSMQPKKFKTLRHSSRLHKFKKCQKEEQKKMESKNNNPKIFKA